MTDSRKTTFSTIHQRQEGWLRFRGILGEFFFAAITVDEPEESTLPCGRLIVVIHGRVCVTRNHPNSPAPLRQVAGPGDLIWIGPTIPHRVTVLDVGSLGYDLKLAQNAHRVTVRGADGLAHDIKLAPAPVAEPGSWSLPVEIMS